MRGGSFRRRSPYWVAEKRRRLTTWTFRAQEFSIFLGRKGQPTNEKLITVIMRVINKLVL